MGKLVYSLEELFCLKHTQKYNIDEKPPCVEHRHVSEKKPKGKGRGLDRESDHRKHNLNGYSSFPFLSKNGFNLTEGAHYAADKKMRQVPLQAWQNSSIPSGYVQEFRSKLPRADLYMMPISLSDETRSISPPVLYGQQGQGLCQVVHQVPRSYFGYRRGVSPAGEALYSPIYNVFTRTCLVSIGPDAFRFNSKRDFETTRSYTNTISSRNNNPQYRYIHRLSDDTHHIINTFVDQKENEQHKVKQINPYSVTGFFPESFLRASKSPSDLPDEGVKDPVSSRDKCTLENDIESQATESSSDSFNIQIKITS